MRVCNSKGLTNSLNGRLSWPTRAATARNSVESKEDGKDDKAGNDTEFHGRMNGLSPNLMGHVLNVKLQTIHGMGSLRQSSLRGRDIHHLSLLAVLIQ